VASRPVEQFQTSVTLPEWQLEPDDEAYYGQPDSGIPTVDGGQPGASAPGQQQPLSDGGDSLQGTAPAAPDDDWQGPPPPPIPGQSSQPQPRQKLDQQWMDGVLGRRPPAAGGHD
jgi:penicillin-binding protein 1A